MRSWTLHSHQVPLHLLPFPVGHAVQTSMHCCVMRSWPEHAKFYLLLNFNECRQHSDWHVKIQETEMQGGMVRRLQEGWQGAPSSDVCWRLDLNR